MGTERQTRIFTAKFPLRNVPSCICGRRLRDSTGNRRLMNGSEFYWFTPEIKCFRVRLLFPIWKYGNRISCIVLYYTKLKYVSNHFFYVRTLYRRNEAKERII